MRFNQHSLYPHVDAVALPGVVPKKDMWEIFRKRPDESRLHYAKRLCSEGHSVPDAFLTCASSQ